MSLSQIKSHYHKKLPKIVESLKKGYKPQRIILFGSMLRPHAKSNDIDLFIIKETDEERRGKRAIKAWSTLPFKDVPVDFLIYTPSEVKRELDRENVFIAEILQKGKVLYEEKIS